MMPSSSRPVGLAVSMFSPMLPCARAARPALRIHFRSVAISALADTLRGVFRVGSSRLSNRRMYRATSRRSSLDSCAGWLAISWTDSGGSCGIRPRVDSTLARGGRHRGSGRGLLRRRLRARPRGDGREVGGREVLVGPDQLVGQDRQYAMLPVGRPPSAIRGPLGCRFAPRLPVRIAAFRSRRRPGTVLSPPICVSGNWKREMVAMRGRARSTRFALSHLSQRLRGTPKCFLSSIPGHWPTPELIVPEPSNGALAIDLHCVFEFPQ